MLNISEVLALLNDNSEVPASLKQWRDVYYGISLHTTGAAPAFDDPTAGRVKPPNYFGAEYQQLFDLLLLNRHPRENDVTRNWRYSQYRPFTKGPFTQIIEVVTGAIFQDSNYNCELANKEDNEYIWGNNFSGYDLIHYFEWAFKHIAEDPNGFFVRIPKEPGYATTTARVEPDVWFIGTKNIVRKTDDELIFHHNGFAWLINKLVIFRFVKRKNEQGAEKWVNADPSGYYAHMMGRLPVDVAGGVWNTQGFNDSWLSKAKAVADDFISSKSAEQLVDRDASHPFIVIPAEDCGECSGSGSVQMDCDITAECPDGIELVKCRTCNGSGQISRNPGEWLTVPKEHMGEKVIDIVSPDTAVNANHREKLKDLMNQMLDSLHLLRVDASQSGVAKTIDQERLYQFISKIANDLFDRIIYNTIRDIIAYRHAIAENGVARPAAYDFQIVKPTQFQVKTAADLLMEYQAGVTANLPAFVRSQMLTDFVGKQFGGNDAMKRKAELITQMDPICTLAISDKQAMVIGGAITRRAWQFSTELPGIMDQLIREKGKDWYIRSEYDTIKVEVDKLFQLIPEINQPAPAAAAPVG